MKLSDFDYNLPKELIAQYPSRVRGDDRLLVVERRSGSFKEMPFAGISDYFNKGDVLVLNDTRVIPARIFGKRKTGGKVEIFILEKEKKPLEAMVRPSARIKENEEITLESGNTARIMGNGEIGRFVEFDEPVDKVLEKCGHVPLPPYISRPDEPDDRKRYQTVYASPEGATASPTAGLHFTDEAIDSLKEKGVVVSFVTLHVSYGTFAPIKEDDIEKHKMHSEFYSIPEETAAVIKGNKAKIFACGTTSLRALETAGRCGYTDLFIYPGYKFNTVDALITNFHLPKSTLLLLACAFAGKELLFEAYEYAIKRKFRFFSYGDAMLII